MTEGLAAGAPSSGAPVQRKESASPPADSATADFNDVYKDKHGRVPVNGGGAMDYDTYRSGLPDIEASSETTAKLTPAQQKGKAAQALTVEMTQSDLLTIFDRKDVTVDPWADPKAQQATNAKMDVNALIADMLPKVNQAFRIMKLDTAGAQAAYLANAYVESDQFRYMTETSAAAKEKPFADQNAKISTGWLDKAAAGQVDGVGGYREGGTINKNGNWNEAFIGRGPLQVTHDYGYASTLAILDKRHEELVAEGNDADAAVVKRAFDAIKQDPSQAANPEYTFLFSAAYMKRPVGKDLKTIPADQLASSGSATSFMGPQFADKKKIKDRVYAHALDVLINRQKAPPAP